MIAIDAAAKGLAAEKLVEADLIIQGKEVLYPSSSISTYDLLTNVGGNFLKLQVKSSYEDNGIITVDARRPSAKTRQYTDGDYDLLAVVDLKSRKVCYIPYDEVSTGRVSVDMTGGRSRRCRFIFEDYQQIKEAV